MTIRARLYLGSAAALAAAAIVVGCENTELTAPPDGTIKVGANPGTVVIDPNQGETEGDSVITAQIFDADGRPLENIALLFSTTGGKLASRTGGSTTPVQTNGSGIATDTLTLTLNDPEEVTVSATSSSLTGTIAVKRRGVGLNQAPLATITVAPQKPVDPNQGAQAVGRPVTFDGSASLDPDGDAITMWRWTITGGASTNCSTGAVSAAPAPEVLEGPTIGGFDRVFSQAQELAVRLQVTDDPGAPADFANARPVAYSALEDSVGPYKIVCVLCRDNTAPRAVIADPDPVVASGPAGQFINVFFDGTLSSDAETAIDDYVWTCGNGTLPTEIGNGARASCLYKVEGAPITYTVSLVVKDKGTGLIDAGTGTFACQAISEADTVQVRVSPLQ